MSEEQELKDATKIKFCGIFCIIDVETKDYPRYVLFVDIIISAICFFGQFSIFLTLILQSKYLIAIAGAPFCLYSLVQLIYSTIISYCLDSWMKNGTVNKRLKKWNNWRYWILAFTIVYVSFGIFLTIVAHVTNKESYESPHNVEYSTNEFISLLTWSAFKLSNMFYQIHFYSSIKFSILF